MCKILLIEHHPRRTYFSVKIDALKPYKLCILLSLSHSLNVLHGILNHTTAHAATTNAATVRTGAIRRKIVAGGKFQCGKYLVPLRYSLLFLRLNLFYSIIYDAYNKSRSWAPQCALVCVCVWGCM